MSYQAMEAVQDCTAVKDPVGKSVFWAISRFADVNGNTADNRLKAPSIDTLAEKAQCHRNTVMNWRERLVELGVLSYETKGQGRGSYNVYHILLDIKPYSDTTPLSAAMKQSNAAGNGTSQDVLIAFNNGLSLMQEMVQEMREMVQAVKELVQETVHNGTSWDVPDTYIHPIATKDTLGEILPPPLTAVELTPEERRNIKNNLEMLRGRPDALWVYTAVNEFPGLKNEWVVVEGLGDKPGLATMRRAADLWRASGWKMTNHAGICDYYREVARDPTWTPGAKFKVSGNGHGPPKHSREIDRSLIKGGIQ